MKTTFAENIYVSQAHANLLSLLYDSDYTARRKALLQLLDEFAKANIEWATTCSFALFVEGIVDNFHDFDLLVAPKSYPAVCEILDRIGTKKTKDKDTTRTGKFSSLFFAEYEIEGIDIDVICEFGFTTFDCCYQYHFNSNEVSIVETREFSLPDNLHIPVIATEAQYVFYGMMIGWQPQRRFKQKLIEDYLCAGNMKRPEFLQHVVKEEDIPAQLRLNIINLLRQAT